jgi:peptide/nickel transport system ATP-binding protein
MVTDPIFELRDTIVTFDMDRGESRVLDEVDLDIERDEVLGVVGESGSGKSMLASSLLNAVVDPGIVTGDITYYPQDGEPVDVLGLDGEDLWEFRWEEVAMVFQGAMSSFNPTMSIGDHFRETLEAHDYAIPEGMQRARELLSDVYLDADRVLESYPHELSGGMQQRALIALSLLLDPDVLVMDEPTAALDLLMQRSIISLLNRLKREYEITIVFITHDLPLVARLADRLAVLYAFELAEVGPTNEIVYESAHPYTRMLLRATPSLDTSVDEMQPIEGSAPDPVNVPTGCAFHPRCRMAAEQCRETDPALEPVDGDHTAACHYPEQTAEAVPFDPSEVAESPPEKPTPGVPDAKPATAVDSPAITVEDPLLAADDVTVEFADEGGLLDIFNEPDVVRAVDDVTLEVSDHDVISLVGESGCGKTTLGKAMVALERPTEGAVRFQGEDVWDIHDGAGDFSSIRQSLQMIHQDPGSALNPNKRVLTSLKRALARRQPELSATDMEENIYALLERVGMTPPDDYAYRYPHQLSGGEQQRVALIRALLMNPDLILADEAVSALDVSLRVEMMNLLLELQDLFDTSFVFISHDLSNARYLAEKAEGRIAVMYLGEIVEVGPVEQLIHDPKHPYTRVLRWATPDLAIDEEIEDVPVRDIDIPDPTDPPSGCRFHTRCPYAREVCTEENPELLDCEDGRAAACFRADTDHEYWDSPSIVDDGATATGTMTEDVAESDD